ncbi:hypothetical protein, partial [Myxococcus xanthus]|uniref:hypothetical protein n=2 Tax=Myxococcus TaxID=32 RepID=UPI001C11D19B
MSGTCATTEFPREDGTKSGPVVLDGHEDLKEVGCRVHALQLVEAALEEGRGPLAGPASHLPWAGKVLQNRSPPPTSFT